MSTWPSAARRHKAAFEAEVPGLVNRLNEILMARLQEERDAQRRSQMYPFQQFAALTPLVAEFPGRRFSATRS